ncbi:FAD binding domain-containing protein [Nocardioides sp. T2.26MG-1]|uniref:FAD binding domain-containing protein n=1 Tax=Nocardioides sp. T2.26MG-1 TaxID=3041166 RepID=UPI002477647C|nr:FAD binding domain-containing protein [Nocardioides sp. T2.26MG-1]CAI9417706.1 Carbon monoxide dehydrogenase medium chain [Nocardioides sp. T2.26MG-1]
MVMVSAYARPSTMDEALELLSWSGAVALAGGTRLGGDSSAREVEVVDLQALRLDGIRADGEHLLRVGAMTRLQQLVDSDRVPALVREAARRERPSTLRAQGTLGGCVATGDGESELLAALLVHEALVHVETSRGADSVPLESFLAGLPLGAGSVVTAVTLCTDGAAAACHTARTPADRAIVAAFARQTEDGRRVALTGVARTPILVRLGDALDPVGDFRGSSEYRRALADVLTQRVVEAIS